MSSDIENLTDKTEKLAIGPIYDTNWCDMPAEIKVECIGKMGINESLSLRCTAKAEKSLVDSQKIEFSTGDFYRGDEESLFNYENHYVALKSKNGDRFYREFKDPHKAINTMKNIWKIGVFRYFLFSSNDSVVKEELKKFSGKISARNIRISNCNKEMVVAVLLKMNTSVESIKVRNINNWYVQYFLGVDCLHNIAQILIDRNSKIGFTFNLSVIFKIGSFEKFPDRFAGSIVSESEKRIRILTNNPDRHILLERGLDEGRFEPLVEYFRLMVISAEMKESEYDDNCEEWINEMTEW